MTIQTSFWEEKAEKLWADFIKTEAINQNHAVQMKIFIEQLLAWNQKSNLTRIVTIDDIIPYHLQDSLRIRDGGELPLGVTVCDVGSGAGFPGIPLAITRPDLTVILMEVNQKKIVFLKHVISLLGLTNSRVIEYDWRTFIRQKNHNVDFFLARASLKVDELVRIFQKKSAYKSSTLIYWASDSWALEESGRPFFFKKRSYTVGSARRWYIFFGYKKRS